MKYVTDVRIEWDFANDLLVMTVEYDDGTAKVQAQEILHPHPLCNHVCETGSGYMAPSVVG